MVNFLAESRLPEIRPAPTGRAVCQLCGKIVAQGELSLYYVFDVFANRRTNYATVHWRCFDEHWRKKEVLYGQGRV